MNDARGALRNLVIYASCLPLALWLGYLVANPLNTQSFAIFGIVMLLVSSPLLLRYHYPFMLLAWNLGVLLFFLPGRLDLWLVAICLSYAIAFTHRIMFKSVQFLSVPELTRPLVFFAVVVLATAELRGGIGLRSMGGEAVGGRRYIVLLVGILGYFALTTRRIPKARAGRYIGLYLLGGTLSAIAVAYGHVPGFLNFIFLLIPPASAAMSAAYTSSEVAALGIFRPFATAGAAAFSYLLARYGIRQILAPERRRLLWVFGALVVLTMLSGSRLALIYMAMVFFFQFWSEGLFRTKLPIFFGLTFIIVAAVTVPFVNRLPMGIQRTLAFLPLQVNPLAKESAKGSSEWRVEMWKEAIPQIPKYLLLGKGYAISWQELAFMVDPAFSRRETDVSERGSFIAGDYHNGPLSVIMPFGLWGVLAFVWFSGAGCRVLWRNYRYGDPDLRNINTYLFASYVVGLISFVFIFGAVATGMVGFTGPLGLSVAFNGGVARPGAVYGETEVPKPVKPGTSKLKPRRKLGLRQT